MNELQIRMIAFLNIMHAWTSSIRMGIFKGHVPSTGHVNLVAVLIGVLIVVTLAALTSLVIHYRERVELRERLALMESLNSGLRTSGNLDDNLNHILSVVSQLIIAPYYALYIWDKGSSRYMLRAASHPYDTFEGVGPAYSGLALPKRDAYLPPSVLNVESGLEMDPVSIIREGDIPLLIVRIGRERALLRVGPVERIQGRQRRLLVELANWLVNSVEDYINLEDERLKLEFKELSDNALIKVASMGSNSSGVIDILLKAFTGIVGGSGGLYLEKDERGHIQLHASPNLSELASTIRAEIHSLQTILRPLVVGEERVIFRDDAEFYDFPLAITARTDVGGLGIVTCDEHQHLLVLLGEDMDRSKWDAIGRRQLSFLTDQIIKTTKQLPLQNAMKRGYTRVLCEIADFLDNLNPFTVGYSNMVTHYSLAVGKVLGLSDDELMDLALAARLSNIGVVAMDMSILVKEGVYSDFEYGLMKRHSEISASMIELVTGNKRASEYVLYHHERVDGRGYPSGLFDTAIPLAAKIIHVIQVFLAKINGRSWRSPQTFEMALKELRVSVGTSLDGSVVNAFEAWWKNQAGRLGVESGNLGYCYEMCCVPNSICQGCPALQNPRRCWEMPSNHCKLHGRDCETCFVKTEYQYRMTSR